VNPTKAKQLTNMRSSSSDGIVKLDTPRLMSLEQCLEFIADDELLEITPLNIRIRKKILNADERIKAKKKAALQAQL
jgi:GTP-binding protein